MNKLYFGERERQTDRQTDRQASRQAGRQRQRDRPTDRECVSFGSTKLVSPQVG